MNKLASLCLLCVLGMVPRASAQYTGGPGDGYDSARLAASFPGVVNFYAGGSGDGYDSARLMTSFPGVVNFYAGGSGDGYDSAALATAFPSFVNFYAGGPGDGYDSATLTTSFPAFVNLYVGGSGGGYASASLFVDALPVELTRFEAVADGPAVVLSWATASETNNAGFEIQPRWPLTPSEQGAWQVMGFVDGHGTTLEPQTYTFRIEDVPPGRHVFRLKQIDFDGAFEYSPEVEVAVELVETLYLSAVYPNPFNPQAQFTLMVRREQSVRVAVYDVQGRRVALLHEGSLAAGTHHRFVFDGAALPSGLYLVRADGETFSAVRSVVLLK